MRDLHVGRDLTWPAAIASQAVGLLGMRGSGKSNLARVVAEELFASKIPFVIFDPIGNWFGIRAGRDGKPGGGLAIPIFGGEHGDLQLDRTAGAKIADLILERRLSCVLDLSHPDLSETDKRRFLVEFGERLFRKKSRESGWLELILEEADDYAPQTTRGAGAGSTAECLGTFQRIVKRGRFKGLGVLMVTQRSAAINKDLLYMVGTLVVFRTTGPRDQEAVAGWVKHNAINAEVMATLPTLADGEAWVIAPESLGSIERSKFRRMATYDTGSTPEHGGAQAATLADIDVPALSKEFAAAAEKAKAEDPRELKRTVAELRAQLAKAQAVKPAAAPAAMKPKERLAVKEAHVKRLHELARRCEVAAERSDKAAAALRDEAKDLRAALGAVAAGGAHSAQGAGRGAASPVAPQGRPAPVVSRAPVAARSTPRANADAGADGLQPARQRILDALAWLESVGIPSANRTQLAMLADQSPTSSAYANNLGALRSLGLIDYGAGSVVMLSRAGRERAEAPETPPTTEALQEAIIRRLQPARARIVKALINVYPGGLSREALADLSSQSATSSAYANNLGALRSLGIIDYVGGEVVAKPVLFLEGAA